MWGFMAHPSLHDGAVPPASLAEVSPFFGTAGDPPSSLQAAWRVLNSSAGSCTAQDPAKKKGRMRPPASEGCPFGWPWGWRGESGWQWGQWVAVGPLLQLRHLLHTQGSFAQNGAFGARSNQK